MTSRQQNFMNMARTTGNVIAKWQGQWSTVPRFVNEASALQAEMKRIEEAAENTLLETKGIAMDKRNAKDEALSAIVNIAKPASVYADDSNNLQLRQQLNVSRGPLSLLTQNDLLNTLTGMYNAVFAEKDHLADYGVTEQKIADAKTKLDAYTSSVPTTRDAIVERKTNNEVIEEGIGNLRRGFHRLDNLMRLFEGTQFYSEYKNARIIVDLGTRKTPEDKPTLPVNE